MILYKDQLRNQKYQIKKVRKGRKKKTVKYCLDILTFDIEVTSAWMSDEGELIGYTPGKDADYWNDMEKFSLPYIWQFGFNDTVYYGRNIYSFLNLLEDLPKKTQYIIWVHNLAYEFGAALINIMKVKKVFARSPHSPIYAVFEEFPDITFKCSYTLTNMSLDTWGKQLGVKKLTGQLDYTVLRTPYTELTQEELEYCERDCIVVYEGIKDHLKIYEDVFDIPMTSTGKVRRVVKNIVTNDKEYMKEIKKLVPRNREEYERFQSVFAGGYTHANRKYTDKIVKGPVHHVDIASSYPTCMIAYKFPYNKWAYIGQYLPDPKTFDHRAYIISLHLTDLEVKTWNTYISSSKCNGRGILADNGRVLKADELYITVTEQDYITIRNTYKGNFESLGTYVCQKKYLPTIFVKYILELYGNKTSLKGIDPVKYAISKQYINSLFGMSVTNIVQANVLFTLEEGWDVPDLTPEQVEYKLSKLRRWFDKSYFLSYPAGCWITSLARREGIWKCIEKMDKDVIYCDTDSLFYVGDYDFTWYNDLIDKRLKEACDYHGLDFDLTRPADPSGVRHPLGHMENEEDCDRFRTLGAKKYCEERDGKLYMTVSGINKGAVSCLNGIEDFKDGFIFDKDAEDVHKNEITYLDNMPRVVWPDGFVSDLKYGINMRPTGYKLSIPKIYDKLKIIVNQAVNPPEQEVIRKRGTVIE